MPKHITPKIKTGELNIDEIHTLGKFKKIIFNNSNPFTQKYIAEKLTLRKMGGNLDRVSSVLAKSTIDLNPHQIHAALYAFNSPLSRGAILADEVGLGKTIEAGIVISQLWAENKRKILILSPASLRKQWQEELFTKFGLESEVWDGPSYLEEVNKGDRIPFTYDGIFITSYNFVYKHLNLIEKQDWNVVIIDEAHRFRNVYKGRDGSKMAYEIREIIKDKPKVLLTATPLQNSLEELYGIVSFIDDKLLGTLYSFKTRFVDPIKQDENGSAHLKLNQLREILRGSNEEDTLTSGVISRTLRKQITEYVQFKNRTSLTFDFTPSSEESELYSCVSDFLQRQDIASITTAQRNLMILVYRKLLASSSFAISGTLKKLMINIDIELDARKKDDLQLTIDSVDGEEEIDEADTEDSSLELEEKLEVITKKHSRISRDNFSNEDLLRERAELERYFNIAVKIKQNSKGLALISALRNLFSIAEEKNYPQKAVIFTESTRTQEYLNGLLKESGIKTTVFNGSNNSPESRFAFERWKQEFPESAQKGSFSANMRQALVYDFKHHSNIFLTTEAGSEGLNLQFANIIINYDLPWNPQRVEQRIGRCHRYGQKYEVIVANLLNTENYADKRLLQLLMEKLSLFDGLFGSSDEILGAIESGIDFEKRILDIYQSCKTPEEYDQAFNELQEKLKDKIEAKTLKYRELLIENTDQSVISLFRDTDTSSKNKLSELDSDLLTLSKLSLLENLREVDVQDSIYQINGHDLPIAFRSLHKEEIGKIEHASLDHEVIKQIIQNAKEIKTNPIPSISFRLSQQEQKIFQLQGSIGLDGFMFLWKLIIKGLEVEEIITPLAFVRSKEGSFQIVSIEAANELLKVKTSPKLITFDKSPIDKLMLLEAWNSYKEETTARYRKRNERLFDRETDRVNRYYDDSGLEISDKICRLNEEKKQTIRRHDNSSDLEERRKYKKKIQELTNKIDKAEVELLEFKKEAAKDRAKELENLWSKLDLEINEELIAIAHFTID